MVDRVQLAKQESAAGGGDPADADPFLWSNLDPNEDAPEVRRLYLQGDEGIDETCFVDRDASGRVRLVDQENPTGASVSDLLGDTALVGRLVFQREGGLVYSRAGGLYLTRTA